jgi:uncharacterized protein
MSTRRWIPLVAFLLVAACSSGSDSSSPTTSVPSTTPPATTPAPTTPTTPVPTTSTTVAPAPATFSVQPGPEQITVQGATSGDVLGIVDVDGTAGATGTVDAQGALLFRQVTPGAYTVRTTTGVPSASPPVTVTSFDDVPPQSFYDGQTLQPGFGYLKARDGTTLSVNVSLPGPADQGPYPTVVEYSGYDPSNPANTTFAQVFTTLGFAYVGVNMRGTGCSGGSFLYFEPIQDSDGYDAIEAVAAQSWVKDHKVGMVGISYPGISQLFVAQTRPPHLAAITPLSVIDDSYTATLYPGGILNTGFAVSWANDRIQQAKPYGQAWSKQRADGGDATCAANQGLRLQNPDLLQLIHDHPYYDAEFHDVTNPTTFVGKIDVPVFLAGAWQDEQTGGHFPAFLDDFTSSPRVDATMVNGLHTESLVSLAIFSRYVEFLDLFVAKKAPDLAGAAIVAPLLAGSITGVQGMKLPPGRFEGMTYEQALAAYEATPPVRILFEEGAADGQVPGSPLPRYEASFPSWPIASAVTTPWYLGVDGALQPSTPTETAAASGTVTSYRSDPTALPPTFYTGDGSAIWQADVSYDWRALPDGTAATWITPPLGADTVVVGPGSMDLWLRSSAPDTDLEVTVSEVRPDGQEVYVQSGWLRASHRELDETKSTELRPVHTHLEADASPLPAGELTPVRVELFPFAYAFRAGSRLRVSVDAPGGNRAVWAFDTLANGETNEIAHDAEHPSRLVLAVVPGIAVPPGAPACGSLRGQPCRTYVAPG